MIKRNIYMVKINNKERAKRALKKEFQNLTIKSRRKEFQNDEK